MDMETNLLIVGKGDDILTMIFDNLASNNEYGNVDVLNNLNLEILNKIAHPSFNINMFTEVDVNQYPQFCLGVYNPSIKKTLVNKYNLDINKAINVIHSTLSKSDTAILGGGILINSLVSIAAHTIIGNYVSINRHVSIGHHTTIGNYTSINPGVNIAGNVSVGEATTIGMGANVLNKIKIGSNTIVGAGSVVTKDLPDNVVAYGNPCKIIRENI
jgi:sugar O-acyltransferase (sialic acid O-acetyltransferase NeuD family)